MRIERIVAKLVASTYEYSPLVASEPSQRFALHVWGRHDHADTRRTIEGIQEADGSQMTGSTAQEGPRFTTNMIGRHKRRSMVSSQQRRGLLMALVPTVAKGDPEGRVDEDHL